ncbi:MAG: YlbF family regulator [Bacilli bacterium]|nr:YlbF family regulator [Bacilli bacterium]
MSEIIEKTYKLLDTLDKSDLVKNLTYYKSKLLSNNEVLSLVKRINKETNNEEKVKLKKDLYNINDYKHYMESYNELYYIVLKINKKYSEYTNTKEGACNE